MNLKDIPLKPKIEHIVMCPKCSSPLSTIDGKCIECGQEIDRIFLKPFDGVDWEKKFEDLRHEFSDLINKLDELGPDCVRSPHGINVYRALTSSGKINITGAGTAPSKFH